MSFLTHLECGYCGASYDANKIWNLCPDCKKPLLARYDLEAARNTIHKNELADQGTYALAISRITTCERQKISAQFTRGIYPIIPSQEFSKRIRL